MKLNLPELADGDRLVSFASGKSISPFIFSDLASRMKTAIRFQATTGGTVATGYEATILADMRDAHQCVREALSNINEVLHECCE